MCQQQSACWLVIVSFYYFLQRSAKNFLLDFPLSYQVIISVFCDFFYLLINIDYQMVQHPPDAQTKYL